MELEIGYLPHTYQKLFHNSRKKIRVMTAGIRSGKTLALVNESIRLSLAGGPFCKTPNRGAIIAPVYTMMKDVVLPEWKRFMPFELVRSFSKFELKAKLMNGSEILFRSAEHPDRLYGLDLNWFAIDEVQEVSEDVYQILRGRIAQKKGCGFMVGTPKPKARWLYDLIRSDDPDVDVIPTFSSYDNPYFDKREVEKLKNTYTDDFFRQEVKGEWVFFSGLVYNFEPAVHVIDPKLLPDEFVRYFAGMDFGFSLPAAIVIVGEAADGTFYILDEFFQSGKVLSDLIEILKAFNSDYPLEAIYCDPSRPEFISEINDAGLVAIPGNNRVADGIRKVQELLKQEKLKVCINCTNTIREFQTYSYKPGTEIPVKRDDHCADAIRYCLSTDAKLEQSSDLIVSF